MSTKDAIDYFKECVAKDNIFEEDLTLSAMKVVLNELDRLQKENKQLLKGQQSLMQSRKKWKDRYYKEKKYNKLKEIEIIYKDLVDFDFDTTSYKDLVFISRITQELKKLIEKVEE